MTTMKKNNVVFKLQVYMMGGWVDLNNKWYTTYGEAQKRAKLLLKASNWRIVDVELPL